MEEECQWSQVLKFQAQFILSLTMDQDVPCSYCSSTSLHAMMLIALIKMY